MFFFLPFSVYLYFVKGWRSAVSQIVLRLNVLKSQLVNKLLLDASSFSADKVPFLILLPLFQIVKYN